MKDLNLRYLLEGTPVRMRWARRWTTSRVHFPENVAEHSYFVCLYAMMITRWYLANRNVRPVYGDPEPTSHELLAAVLQKAVLHDIEEARSGDIHRPFKYSRPDLKQSLDMAAVEAARQTLLPIFGTDITTEWAKAKDDSLAGRIVKFSDLLAVLAFLKQEPGYGKGGVDLSTLPAHFERFLKEDFDFIRPIVNQANDIVQEIMSGSW